MLDLLFQLWPGLVAALHLLIGLVTSSHVVLNKEDERAAIGWVGVIWLAPVLGSLLYFLFGINRIRRRAQVLRSLPPVLAVSDRPLAVRPERVRQQLSDAGGHLVALARLVGEITRRPLLAGNRIEPLWGGDEAFPPMLQAIRDAKQTVALSTYIFDNDGAGEMFRQALSEAVKNGVEVRVLIDDVGTRYTWPPMARKLSRVGIPTAKFNPTWPWKFRYSNLRNHRKILVVDGRIGFTGGINIREGNLLSTNPRHPVRDLHFRIEGPVVHHLMECFAVDWSFSTDELLEGEAWFPRLREAGTALARGISDGPDEDYDKFRLTILGAISLAQKSVIVVSPYFIPDLALITALNVAAMRGVEVHIIVPEKNNLMLVKWASSAVLPELVAHGCRVWLAPPPFDHTKLMLVDGMWTLLGSANWDQRSLRLNFEFNVESYDAELTGRLEERVRYSLLNARELTREYIRQRRLLRRLRDGIAHLAAPYL